MRPIPLVLLLAAPAAADVVVLKGGQEIVGIVGESDEKQLKVEVAEDGWAILDGELILGIRLASEASNQELRARWRKADAEARKEKDADEAFERRQAEKGLELYDGEWLTAAQIDRRLAERRLALEEQRLKQPPPVVQYVSQPAPPVLVVGPFHSKPRRSKGRMGAYDNDVRMGAYRGIRAPYSGAHPGNFGLNQGDGYWGD